TGDLDGGVLLGLTTSQPLVLLTELRDGVRARELVGVRSELVALLVGSTQLVDLLGTVLEVLRGVQVLLLLLRRLLHRGGLGLLGLLSSIGTRLLTTLELSLGNLLASLLVEVELGLLLLFHLFFSRHGC